VGAAGPLTNFVLSFIGFTALVFFQNAGIFTTFLHFFVIVNLGFFIFNMIPLPPLDGSRVLYAVAPRSVQQVMEGMERYGIIVVFAVVLLFNAQLAIFMQAAMGFFLHLFSLPFGNLLMI
jgi:Zn-dependent protease